MPFINIANQDIHFSVKDSGEDETLVMIHGSGGDHRHWRETLKYLSGVNGYAIDLPGHGKSGGKGCDRVEDYADVIEAFVSRCHLSRVILMGHSLGGAIVQTLALASPSWLSRIILVGTGSRLRVTSAILEGLLSDFKATVDLICRYAFAPDTPESLISEVREGFLNKAPEVIHGDFSACNRFDITERVSHIRLPTRIISGSADRLTPVKYGEYLCQQIQNARHAIIPDAGHMMMLEKPEIFAETVIQALSL